MTTPVLRRQSGIDARLWLAPRACRFRAWFLDRREASRWRPRPARTCTNRRGRSSAGWETRSRTSSPQGEQTGEAFTLVDEQAKRGESVPLHRHQDDMESFYVLDGEITFYIGAPPGARARAGSFVHLPGRDRSRLSRRVGDGPLPDPHHPAARAVLPRHHSVLPARRVAAARVGRRIDDRAGVRGVRHRVRRTAARRELSLAHAGPRVDRGAEAQPDVFRRKPVSSKLLRPAGRPARRRAAASSSSCRRRPSAHGRARRRRSG